MLIKNFGGVICQNQTATVPFIGRSTLNTTHQSEKVSGTTLPVSNLAKLLFGKARLIISLCILILASGVCFSANANNFTASYYTYKSCVREGTSGVWTASGERFNENDLTCAMRSRDFGKYYKITNLKNGKSVVVRHNDYGPNKKLWKQGRVVDLSKAAFMAIADLKQGVIPVSVEVL